MDKKGWFIIFLCVLGIIGSNLYNAKQQREWREAQAKNPPSQPPSAAAPGPTANTANASTTPGAEGSPVPGNLQSVPPSPAFKEAEHVLEVNDPNKKHVVRYVFTNRAGGVKRVEFPGDPVSANGASPVVMSNSPERPIGALSDAIGRVEFGEYALITSTPDTVVYEGPTYNGIIATKTYKVVPAPEKGLPSLSLSVKLRNPTAVEANTTGWFLIAGTAAPLLADEQDAQTGAAWLDNNEACFESTAEFKGGWFSSDKTVLTQEIIQTHWFGVINQFYAVLLTPAAPSARTFWATPMKTMVEGRRPGEQREHTAVQAALSLGGSVIPANAQSEVQWSLFAGPKNYDALKRTGPGYQQVLLYSDMPIFGWLAAPFSKMLNWTLHRIKGVVPDFGIAIIILTIIIRVLIWPLHAKAQRTMKRMSLLNPLMQESRTKYESDPQRMQMETMKLYHEYNVSPLGGCLPLLLQMPIFFGFYRMLQYAAELRHENFLWVKDLAQPDTLFHLSIPGMGSSIPVNALPLLMALSMVVQMEMTPQTGDKTQQRIFAFMPFIFLFISYNFASALSLYWTTTNIFSIGQSWWMKRQPEVTLEKRKPRPKGTASMSNERRRMMGLPPEKEKKSGKRPPRPGG